MSGDKLFIPQGYKQQLSKMDLTEVIPKPYFQRPFITIAKDKNNQEYAVIFQSSDEYEKVKLPVSYEKIISELKGKGYKVKYDENVFLLKINDKLYWVFDHLYMDLSGKDIGSPWGNSTS